MAVLTRKRYVLAGDFSMKDRHGLTHHLTAGDELPMELQELLTAPEISVHLSCGLFRPVGWTPPPPQTPEPATPPAPQEIISDFALPTSGPRGVELRELGKPPSPRDLAACAALGGPTVVIVHRLPDGEAVATLNFGRLMRLYSSMLGARWHAHPPLPIQTFTASVQFFGSVAGGALAAATNPGRSFLSLQGITGALRALPVGSVSASSPLIGSQAVYTAPPGYTGAIYLNPDAGATAPVAVEEFSY